MQMIQFPFPVYTLKLLFIFVYFTTNPAFAELLQNWNFKYTGSDSSFSVTGEFLKNRNWQIVQIPHTYNNFVSHTDQRAGYGWYVHEIEDLKYDKICSYNLLFEGVCLRASVFVNGNYVGKSNQPYLPFKFKINSFLRKGKNIIAVRIDNTIKENDIPDVNCNGWWLYGGIARNVSLEIDSGSTIENVLTRTIFVESGTFDFAADLITVNGFDSILFLVNDLNENRVITTYVARGEQFSCRVNAQEWSPENPVLYRLDFIPIKNNKRGKVFSIKRGFAQFRCENGLLYLNNECIYLKGIGRHDVATHNNPFLSDSACLWDLVQIKKMGFNFLRIAHFPQRKKMYEFCDSLGLLVMDEIPAWKTDADFLCSKTGIKAASDYVENLISDHGNYVSIALWSIGNEFKSYKKNIGEYVKEVTGKIKKIDSSRLVTYCSYFYQFDKAYTFVDVISVNEYFGWFIGSIELIGPMLKGIHEQWPEKPIIISEFGAAANYGYYNKNAQLGGSLQCIFKKDFSEDHQALYLTSHVDEILKYQNICRGFTIWCFNDFMESRVREKTQTVLPGLNTMGIFSEDRNRKLAFAEVQKILKKIAGQEKCE